MSECRSGGAAASSSIRRRMDAKDRSAAHSNAIAALDGMSWQPGNGCCYPAPARCVSLAALQLNYGVKSKCSRCRQQDDAKIRRKHSARAS